MSASLARNCWHIICTSDVSQSSSVASSHILCHQLMKFKDIKSVSGNHQKCLSLMSLFSIHYVVQNIQQTAKNRRRLESELSQWHRVSWHIRTRWVTTAVCSWTSDNMSSARGARVWFCSHDCHNRLWGAVRVQTSWLSAMFTVVYTERTHADSW